MQLFANNRFLMGVGAKTTLSLLKKGADVDCIEEVLSVLISQQATLDAKFAEMQLAASQTTSEAVTTSKTEGDQEEGPEESVAVEEPKTKKLEHPLLKWLTGIAKLDKFELMLRFANKELMPSISHFLVSIDSSSELKEKYGLRNT